MGKCMRPDNDVGVRTRAKTLALQRLHSVLPTPDSSYLDLRPRRLAKSLPPRKPPPTPANDDAQFQPCFGESTIDCQPRERGSRESTPCTLVGITISTPRKQKTCATREGARSHTESLKTTLELEEMFGHEERSQQRLFIEKYNFDIVNELPLPGRYEWVTIRP